MGKEGKFPRNPDDCRRLKSALVRGPPSNPGKLGYCCICCWGISSGARAPGRPASKGEVRCPCKYNASLLNPSDVAHASRKRVMLLTLSVSQRTCAHALVSHTCSVGYADVACYKFDAKFPYCSEAAWLFCVAYINR